MSIEKTILYSKVALPHLIKCAELRQTITYSGLAIKIGCPHHRPISRVLGYIRDTICIPNNCPLITSLVVSKHTGLPGQSFLPEGTSHLSKKQYREQFEKLRDQVYAFTGWNALLKKLGLSSIPNDESDLDNQGRAHTDYMSRQGGGESEEHRRLKVFIAEHPEILGLLPIEKPEIEFLFISGDRADVTFNVGSDGHAIVEIKKGEMGELVKGIYQAVKYRSLLEAENGHGKPHPVSAYLVAYSIPEEIVIYADKFNVKCLVVEHDRVMSN